jgi:hypothetical protein
VRDTLLAASIALGSIATFAGLVRAGFRRRTQFHADLPLERGEAYNVEDINPTITWRQDADSCTPGRRLVRDMQCMGTGQRPRR